MSTEIGSSLDGEFEALRQAIENFLRKLKERGCGSTREARGMRELLDGVARARRVFNDEP
jgi:hypothetical protein